MAVSPGFIDVHSHDDFAVLLDPAMPFKVMQGVTTDVVGNCGSGVVPYDAAMRRFSRIHPGRPRRRGRASASISSGCRKPGPA